MMSSKWFESEDFKVKTTQELKGDPADESGWFRVHQLYKKFHNFDWGRKVKMQQWGVEEWKAHAEALQAQIDAQRASAVEADRNAMDLYAENESLRSYRAVVMRDSSSLSGYWVDRVSYNAKVAELEKERAISHANITALKKMTEDWSNFFVSNDWTFDPKRIPKEVAKRVKAGRLNAAAKRHQDRLDAAKFKRATEAAKRRREK
jgi:hypothetical protein